MSDSTTGIADGGGRHLRSDASRPLLSSEERSHILVVDDRPDQLLVLQTILDELGQNVVLARCGDEALKRVLQYDFAVILLDVNMPGMDGLETAAFIRRRQRTAHTPIIFVTAYADEIHAARGYSLGAVDYILSPINPEVLRSKIRVFVQLDRMKRQIQRQATERIALAREQAARAAAEESIRRFSFLANLAETLEPLIDLEARAEELARFIVPFLGDLAALVLLGERGHIRQTELAWLDPARPSQPCGASVALIESSPFAGAIERVLTSGQAQALEDLQTPALLWTRMPKSVEPVSISTGLAIERLVAFPLRARGRTQGALLLAFASGRPFDSTEFSFAQAVAGRAAMLLDNALLYQEVRKADERKDEFLAMLGHELRNPMAPIRYAVQILHKSNVDEGKRSWALDVIERQVTQLARLVDDLLDVSRITSGQIELKLEPVDLTRVVSAAVETSRPLIDSLKHELVLGLPPEMVLVHGDFARLTQVLANLLNNAAKYTEPGGRIELLLARAGKEACLRVRDSGIGILPENAERIFELFARVDRRMAPDQGGLGIGLTLVQRLVRLHRGSIEVISAGADQGTEFVVRLPVLESQLLDTPRSERKGERAQPPALRVLVVDDNVDAADAMTASLRMEGHEAQAAYDGETALQEARTFRPNAVLLDIGLPGMSGLDVARSLRSLPETQHALLIALSGYGQLQDRQRSLEAGLDDHLIKPVDPSILSSLFVALRSDRRRAGTGSGV